MSACLALLLGAKRILLLGIDVKIGPVPNKSHWHNATIETPRPDHYAKFHNGFRTVALALPNVYPDRQIVNVTNGASNLSCFPCCSFEEVGLTAPTDGEPTTDLQAQIKQGKGVCV
jgi:hypothetical protein